MSFEERQDNEKVNQKSLPVIEIKFSKKILSSKALPLAETPPPAAEVGPLPRDKAAAFVVPEAVLPTDEDEDDDFQVTFSFGL